jgi:hypothetical protein
LATKRVGWLDSTPCCASVVVFVVLGANIIAWLSVFCRLASIVGVASRRCASSFFATRCHLHTSSSVGVSRRRVFGALRGACWSLADTISVVSLNCWRVDATPRAARRLSLRATASRATYGDTAPCVVGRSMLVALVARVVPILASRFSYILWRSPAAFDVCSSSLRLVSPSIFNAIHCYCAFVHIECIVELVDWRFIDQTPPFLRSSD